MLLDSLSVCGFIGLRDRLSRRYSSTQKSSFGCGLGVGFSAAIGFSGIFISGRHPNGGGTNEFGDGLRSGWLDDNPFVLSGGGSFGGGGGGLGKT